MNYNGPFDIATGRSRKETHWRNKEMQWSEFLERIATTHRTAEKLSEYLGSKKTRQDEIKDVGGFVGGYVNNGRRKAENITHRQLITLDVDFSNGHTWDDFCMLYPNAAAVYSTHKHSPESPRLRLILPLDRPVSCDEYVAIARRIAGSLDINTFDDTTFEPSRLMYWPSTSSDAEYIFLSQDGPWMSADEMLSTYKDWRNASEWPVSDRSGEIILREIKKQGDPLEKPGIVGAFCREYDIHEVLDIHLDEYYEACDIDNRYTYRYGSTAAGLVVYDDKFAYSHHGTDPASGKLCNAFDLVRIHLFGLKDENAKEDTPVNRLPSFEAMVEMCGQDQRVKRRIATERLEKSKGDFAEEYVDEDPDTEWLGQLEIDKKGNIQATISNVCVILQNDPNLKGKFIFDDFRKRELATGNLPWRKVTPSTMYMTDHDDSGLRWYIEKAYKISSKDKVKDALVMEMKRNTFHPIKDYLNSFTWDGIKRIETLLIDYMGAEDSTYVRMTTRKTIIAAVARIFSPGCKFDYVLIINGEQGIGKSTIVKKLGRDWYSDSFTGFVGKDAFEQLIGAWILEMAELSSLKKAEAEQAKHFISKTVDRYRVAYGTRIEDFPRQCIFIGTTNNHEFLKDVTGNRRFWPIDTDKNRVTKSVWDDLTTDEIGQIWAEALTYYKEGEDLFLTKELEEYASVVQQEHREVDDRTGIVQKFLDTLLPVDWDSLDTYQRRTWLNSEDALKEQGYVRRDKVCVAEIWCELFNKPLVDMSRYNTYDIHGIMKSLHGWKQYSKSTKRFKNYGIQKYYSRDESVNKNEGENTPSLVNKTSDPV